MVDYRYLIVDPTTGLPICEAPLEGVTFSYMMNAIGQLSGHFPAEANFAINDVFGEALRELTVLRDGDAVWNGPITLLSGTRLGGWDLTADEASWWMTKRTIETDQVFTSEDVFQIVRDLSDYMTSKTATGNDGMTLGDDLVAALPRWHVTAGSAGVTKSYTFSGTAGHTIMEALEDALVADSTDGLDWRMDYRTGSIRQSCSRTLTLGSPQLGVTQTIQLREHLLYDYSRTLDWDQCGNRITVKGSGYVKTLENTGSTVTRVEPLIERVFDRSDVNNNDAIDAYCHDARRACRPPVRNRWVEFVPSTTLPFGWCDLGDVVPFDFYSDNILRLFAQHRRVTQIDVTPPGPGQPEIVRLSISTAMDVLGD